MASGIKDPVEALRFRPRENYLRKPLPSARDDRITDLIETLRDEESVTLVAEAVATVETVLSPYVQRVAALAVRSGKARYLHAGLRAAALMGVGDDPREVAVVLALLWRSAELLNLEPRTWNGIRRHRRCARQARDVTAGLCTA
ncbi:hypothetical protein [Micromonospora sp. NPDC004704]